MYYLKFETIFILYNHKMIPLQLLKVILSHIIFTLYGQEYCIYRIQKWLMPSMDGFTHEILLYSDPYKKLQHQKTHIDLLDMHTILMFLIKTVRKQCCSQVLSWFPLSVVVGSVFCGSVACSQTGHMEQWAVGAMRPSAKHTPRPKKRASVFWKQWSVHVEKQ